MPWKYPDDLIESAWVLLANAWEGDWSRAPRDWRDAVIKWREGYHAWLDDLHEAGRLL